MPSHVSARDLISVCIITLLGAALALAGGSGGLVRSDVSVFIWCAGLAFGLNWLVYVPSALARTEHYYDLTGGLTYLLVTGLAVVLSQPLDLRSTLVVGMVSIWAIRLAGFLFVRVKRVGKDIRFDSVKTKPSTFLVWWTLQALWVLTTMAAALAIVTGGERISMSWLGWIGFSVWLFGFAVEVVADAQKSSFKDDPVNQGDFIRTGLWAWSRHPNYFGEIVLWTGVAIMAIPVLTGWQYATLISPVFVSFLLMKMSGVPLLERKADERWGGQEEYEAYKAATPVLIPRPPRVGK
jgi:steroid 5-alpha reductase family enzyme